VGPQDCGLGKGGWVIFLSLEMAVHGLKLWAPCEIMESSLVVKVLGDQAPRSFLPWHLYLNTLDVVMVHIYHCVKSMQHILVPPPLTHMLNTLNALRCILLCKVNTKYISFLLPWHLGWMLWMCWCVYHCARSMWHIDCWR
jgi:hypothetical protein